MNGGSTNASTLEPPRELIESIRAGNCVAFVGAGMTQPSMPSWSGLLSALVSRIPPSDERSELEGWLKTAKTSRDWEAIAEQVAEQLGPDGLVRGVKSIFEGRELRAETRERLRKLRAIPFHLVLTTNFDHLVRPAVIPETGTFGDLLTMPVRPWWNAEHLWVSSSDGERLVVGGDRFVKLHGDICDEMNPSLVFTTRSYRSRIYEMPGYRSFLRTLFATKTVLFMGFSFADAYINDIRSEVLSGFKGPSAGRGADYAILEDVPDVMVRHLRKHDGLEALTFDTAKKTDFTGFDLWLDAIHARSNPVASLRERIDGLRLLWVDENLQNNLVGFKALMRREGEPGGAHIKAVRTVEAALSELGRVRDKDEPGYGLIVTHFGYKEGQPHATAQRLLLGMRTADFRVPVIVFASGAHRAANRKASLELGALAYTDSWPELFHEIDDLVTDPCGSEGAESRDGADENRAKPSERH